MLFIIMQQVHPGSIIEHMQSQHDWIIFALDPSPLVHIMLHPISVISILHIPMGMQQ